MAIAATHPTDKHFYALHGIHKKVKQTQNKVAQITEYVMKPNYFCFGCACPTNNSNLRSRDFKQLVCQGQTQLAEGAHSSPKDPSTN